MRYCINIRQPAAIRKNADELKVNWQDREYIIDVYHDDPKSLFILDVPEGIEGLGLKKLEPYKDNIILSIKNFKYIENYKEVGFNYFWSEPITNYYDLRNAVNAGVNQVLIGAPLYFDLRSVHDFNIPIRLTANLADQKFFPKVDSYKGPYIRPEDVVNYEQYVETIEFYSTNLKQEETLLRIYQKEQFWGGNLNILITNLNKDIDNRSLPDSYGHIRMTCRQRCMKDGTCHYCDQAFIFGNTLVNN